MNLIVLKISDIRMQDKKQDVFKNSKIKVPFFYPSISKEDQLAVKNALNLPLLTDGPLLQKFENNFASFSDQRFFIYLSLFALNHTSLIILQSFIIRSSVKSG